MKTATGIAAVLASMALLPAAAGAETVVPPGNSAATQYTEAIPTAGGNAVSNGGIDGGHGSSPAKVIGKGNAEKLEKQGKVGHEVANLAAQTAPSAPGASAPGSTGGAAAGGDAGNGSHGTPAPGSSGRASAPGTNGGSGGQAASGTGDGRSGLGEVLGQATGSSSGQVGLLLPLIIVAALAWGAAYAWRRRRGIVH